AFADPCDWQPVAHGVVCFSGVDWFCAAVCGTALFRASLFRQSDVVGPCAHGVGGMCLSMAGSDAARGLALPQISAEQRRSATTFVLACRFWNWHLCCPSDGLSTGPRKADDD